jgi:hypothetical protein
MADPTRPYRDLCPEADKRDAMTDDEFWVSVFPNEGESEPEPDHISLDNAICPICDAQGECGFDNDDRPWIHIYAEDDD